MSLHFANGRSQLNIADWSIATSAGGNLTTQSLYFSLQAANQAGKNLMLVSDVVNITTGDQITFTINQSALLSGEGWTHYIIGVSTTTDVTTFEQIAKIPIYDLDVYNNINFDAPDIFPLSLTLTEDDQLTTGIFVETLPTTNLVDGMIRGVDDADNFIYEYDAVVGEWNKVASFSNYIEDVFYEGGCSVDLSKINNFEYVKTPTYIPNGTNSAKIWYFLKNDSSFEIPAGTSIKILVDVDGYDKTKLFDNKIFYTIKGFSLEEECLLRTVYLDSGQPLDFINFEQTHTAAFPTLNLKDKVRVGESVFIELYINVHEQEFAGQLAQGNISIIPQFVKSVATYNPVGSLFEKGIIYNRYANSRVSPSVGLSAIVGEGSGLIKSYFFYQTQSTLTGFANNTADQQVYINRSGITYLDTQERDDTLLRAIVDTTAQESHVGDWSSYGVVAANDALLLTVSYPCDVDLVASVRSDYPDVLANQEVYFNVKKINIYIQRESDGEIRKFANRLVAAGQDQNFTIDDWASGEVVSSVPTTKASFFNPSTVTFATIGSVGNLTATNYRVTYSFVYEGDVISDISHSPSLGCVNEAAKSGEDVFGITLYSTIDAVKAITILHEGDQVHCLATNQDYTYYTSGSYVVDNLYVFQPDTLQGYWVSTLHYETHTFVNNVKPTATDDITLGYKLGDKWLDTVGEKEYTLIDNTVGAAVWKQVGGGEIIELSSDVTWYVAADGDASADGLTVGTPITLEEAASRVNRVVPTDNNFTITIEIADGSYTYANNYVFVAPPTEFSFAIKLHGQDWVGVNAYPTANISTKQVRLINFEGYCYIENIHYERLTIDNCSCDILNVASANFLHCKEYNGYIYVHGTYKFSNSGSFAFSCTNGYIDIDVTTFDSGGTTRNYTQGFIWIGYGGALYLYNNVITTGTFTGKKIEFFNNNAILDGGEEYIASLPGDVMPTYPNYIFTPSNTLATTASLATVATSGSYNDLLNLPTIELSSDVTWYVATDGDADADGLTVGTSITLDEAFARLSRINATVVSDINIWVTIILADGTYSHRNYCNYNLNSNYTYSLSLQGADWVGINSEPTVTISNSTSFSNWNGELEIKNIKFNAGTTTLRDCNFCQMLNVSVDGVSLLGRDTYMWAQGTWICRSTVRTFQVVEAYLELDIDEVTDNGSAKNYLSGFIEIGIGGRVGIDKAPTITGTFTGKRINYNSHTAWLDYGTEFVQSLPGDTTESYPAYLGSRDNTLATTASLGTASAVNTEDITGTTIITVTVDTGKFLFNGLELTNGLLLLPGRTYRFDLSDATNATHDLRFSITSDGTHGGGVEYTTGVTATGTSGTDGIVTFIPPVDAPETLYPYCITHASMGGTTVFKTKGGGEKTAAEITVDTTNFNSNLSGTDTTVQAALETLDDLVAGGGGHTIQNEGISLIQRTNLNFVGENVVATDDSNNDSTIITINGIPGGLGTADTYFINLTNVTTGETVTTTKILPKSMLVYKIETSSSVRIRQYLSSDYRTADLARASTTPIEGDHGCYYDVITKTEKSFVRNLAPPAVAISNGTGYFSITNLEGSTLDINIQITALPLEV